LVHSFENSTLSLITAQSAVYKIFINKEEIGTSLLESGDPPMGVASGLIQLNNISIRALESMLLQIESTQSIDGVIPNPGSTGRDG